MQPKHLSKEDLLAQWTRCTGRESWLCGCEVLLVCSRVTQGGGRQAQNALKASEASC